MDKVIKLPVIIGGVSTRKDGSLKIVVETMLEIDPEQSSVLFALANKTGYMAFSESSIKGEEMEGLPEIKPDFVGEKTPSQRMRAVLYRWWEQTGKTGDFELFYRRHYERMIDQVKEKLQ